MLSESRGGSLRTDRWLVTLLAFLLLAVACDNGGGEDGAVAEGEQNGPTSLRVTTLFLCSEVNIAWAIEKGIFEEQGLEIELLPAGGGAAGLASIISGDADITTTTPSSAIISAAEGFPTKLVSGSFEANPEGSGVAEGIVVLADSEIQEPADLVDRRLGVNELGGQNHIFTRAWIRQAGVVPEEVNTLALPFPELVPALEDERIDAALLTGSQAAQMVDAGTGRMIGNPLVDVIGPVPIAVYSSTTEFLEENREAVEGFVAALDEASNEIEDPANREEVLRTASGFCEAPVEGLRAERFKDWNAYVDLDTLNGISEILVEEGLLQEPYAVEELVAETALAP